MDQILLLSANQSRNYKTSKIHGQFNRREYINLQGILAEMPKVSPEVEWTPEDREVERRRDLRRSHTVMSIDPRGCTDVDDTLSVKHLSNGNVELGVHIADVTHFVKQDSLTGRRTRQKTQC